MEQPRTSSQRAAVPSPSKAKGNTGPQWPSQGEAPCVMGGSNALVAATEAGAVASQSTVMGHNNATEGGCTLPQCGVLPENPKKAPEFVEVVIEVPKGSMVKRRPDGLLDFFLPFPCPFNYGSVTSIRAQDGDPLDAIVLGAPLPYGHVGTWRVKGILKFMDAGIVDDKLVCVQTSSQTNCLLKQAAQQLQGEITILDWLALNLIFSAYSPFKQLVNVTRGLHGATSFIGLDFYEQG
ncbi:hypothetical protein L7F22_017096 [Adiantum nelumboides]|nr:hypothetical protein [Adiantum nelumboides]